MQGDLKNYLDAMPIPEPSTGAAQRVVSQAKHTQQSGVGFWWRFNRFRAWFFQLHVRYVVMAAVVIFFAAIGRIGQMSPAVSDAEMLAQMDVLEEVDFAFDSWADDLTYSTVLPSDAAEENTPLEGIEFEFEHWADDVEWLS